MSSTVCTEAPTRRGLVTVWCRYHDWLTESDRLIREFNRGLVNREQFYRDVLGKETPDVLAQP